MAKKINITAQLNAATTDGILADAGQIFDAKKGKFQEQVNEEFENALEEAITSEETEKVVESIEEGIVHNALRKNKQILTEAEKYQVRHNISAITAEEAEKIAQDKINEAAVSSPDKLQAVKELSSWLKDNPDSAATMNAGIQDNAADIQSLYRGTGIDEYSQFSTGMDYAAGAVVLYDGVLFRFKADHAKGAWDYNEVEEWSEKKEREEKLTELGSIVSNPEYVRAYTDSEGRFLWGIKTDGSIEFAKGVPTPIKNYVVEVVLSRLDNEIMPEIEALKEPHEQYLKESENPEYVKAVTDADGRLLYGIKKNGDFVFGVGIPSAILKSLEEKVNVEEGKSLINDDIVESIQYNINEEYVYCVVDSEGKLIEATRKDGTKVFSSVSLNGNDTFELHNKEYLKVLVDKNGNIIASINKKGDVEFNNIPKKIKGYVDDKTRTYKKMLEAVEDDCMNPFILGSQLTVPNVSVYDKDLGSQLTFRPEKLCKQFNFPSNVILPNKMEGKLQSFTKNGVRLTIKNICNEYVYLYDDIGFYRVGYSKNEGDIDVEVLAESIVIDCDGLPVYNLFETADGNLLAECEAESGGYPHSLYKLSILQDDNRTLTTTSKYLFTCTGFATVEVDWSIKQYGNRILISPYAAGRTAQIWWSEDYGNSFDCILNLVDDDTFVSTKPYNGGYGATGIHPLPANLIPAQPDNFWDLAEDEGNGNIHVHSTCFDEYFNRIWWVGGDDGGKRITGIYWSDDYGLSWNRMSVMSEGKSIDHAHRRGNMQMLQIISLPNCVLFGSDGWGSGIFRYNRLKKDETPIIEFTYGFTDDHNSTVSVAQSTFIANNGIALLSYGPDRGSNPQYTPTGGIVATDGYNYKEILTDTYNQGNASTIKLHWHIPMIINDGCLYVLCSNNQEIMFTKNQF